MKRHISQLLLGMVLIAAVTLVLKQFHDPVSAQVKSTGGEFDSFPAVRPVEQRRPFASSIEETGPAPAEPAPGFDQQFYTTSEPTNFAAQPVDEKTSLKQQYVALATRRAELMTLEELKTELETAKTETNEVAARRELEEAQRILSRILEQHPDSAAAERAKRMLGTDTNDDSIGTGEAEAEGGLFSNPADGADIPDPGTAAIPDKNELAPFEQPPAARE